MLCSGNSRNSNGLLWGYILCPEFSTVPGAAGPTSTIIEESPPGGPLAVADLLWRQSARRGWRRAPRSSGAACHSESPNTREGDLRNPPGKNPRPPLEKIRNQFGEIPDSISKKIRKTLRQIPNSIWKNSGFQNSPDVLGRGRIPPQKTDLGKIPGSSWKNSGISPEKIWTPPRKIPGGWPRAAS